MKDIVINPIGRIVESDRGFAVQIDRAYRAGLAGLEGFSHLIVIWWATDADNTECRTFFDVGKPYAKVDCSLGVFATRSPMRPNPLCISVMGVSALDEAAGTIETYYVDALPGTPVLDIKPYTPSIDRVASPSTPDWCAHWPEDVESSGDFDWESEFRF